MFTDTLRYLSAFVAVLVPDLDVAADWYGSAFGFVVVTGGVDRGRSWLHLRRSEGQDVVLLRAANVQPGGGPVLHLATEESIWSLTERACEAGADLIEPNPTEADIAGAATFRDPFGYEWVFFRHTVPGPPARGAVRQAFLT